MNSFPCLPRDKIQKISNKAKNANIPFAAVTSLVKRFSEPARRLEQLNEVLTDDEVSIEQKKIDGKLLG